jgi:hypothetical protein
MPLPVVPAYGKKQIMPFGFVNDDFGVDVFRRRRTDETANFFDVLANDFFCAGLSYPFFYHLSFAIVKQKYEFFLETKHPAPENRSGMLYLWCCCPYTKAGHLRFR